MKELLSKIEVAELLTIAPSTLDRVRKEPDFPKPFEIGGSLRWSVHEIVAWLKATR